ncbi:hypothetical protein EIN_384030 [Entamoeba invadens IP1]|uniref:Uncharacterized protein n=1 Tax=Entamoeba invadens IP1 TaxID=370355 RepID=A0A0A1U120_ENTIV|nr:hypothetical protein EIN_384030 [Entamoeba invadens IP1]ELP87699.1 hypothetical protein EIN_384030 [Entamoeba invadens IP1]|eukprot:XP_004254470.1 hypothetical protein EIN_384030 [Entamoeba invadens IP1]
MTTFANWETNLPVPHSEYFLYECTNQSIYFTIPINGTTDECTQTPYGVFNTTDYATDLNIRKVELTNMKFIFTTFKTIIAEYSTIANSVFGYDVVDKFYSYQTTFKNCNFTLLKLDVRSQSQFYGTDLYMTVFNTTQMLNLNPLKLYINWCTIRNSTLETINVVQNTQKVVGTTH